VKREWIHKCSFFGRVVTMVPTLPLPQELRLTLVGRFRKEFHRELPASPSTGSDDNISLRNTEKDTALQRSLALQPAGLRLIWSQGTDDKIAYGMASRIFEIVEEIAPEIASALRHFDTQYVVDFESSENHYALISDVYYAGSPLNKLRAPGRIEYTNDIDYHIKLDPNIVGIVEIIGGHGDDAAENHARGDNTLRLRVNMGRTTELPVERVAETLKSHLARSDELFDADIYPAVVLPMIQRLGK